MAKYWCKKSELRSAIIARVKFLGRNPKAKISEVFNYKIEEIFYYRGNYVTYGIGQVVAFDENIINEIKSFKETIEFVFEEL